MDLNKVKFIEGEKNNFKITDKSDFENLRNIYKSRQSIGIDLMFIDWFLKENFI